MQGVSESEIVMKITVDGETKEVKLPPKHSAILKAKAYLEGISVSQKIVNSIITDLNGEVDSNYEVEEITL